MFKSIVTAASAAVFLAACGGGSGEDSTGAASSPETGGIYWRGIPPAQNISEVSEQSAPVPVLPAQRAPSQIVAPTMAEPVPVEQSMPARVLPEQRAPEYVGGYAKHVTDGYEGSAGRGHVEHGSTFVPAAVSVAAQILEMAADPNLNPTAHGNLLRLAKGAENLEALRAGLVPGGRNGYVMAARYACQYEAMRVTTSWHMGQGRHATISEQQDEGARFRQVYGDCATVGDSMSDAELSAAAAEPLKLPDEPLLLAAAPSAQGESDLPFDLQKPAAMTRILANFRKVEAERKIWAGFDDARYSRLNRLYSALSAQLQTWRDSQSLDEVRSRIDAINAQFAQN